MIERIKFRGKVVQGGKVHVTAQGFDGYKAKVGQWVYGVVAKAPIQEPNTLLLDEFFMAVEHQICQTISGNKLVYIDPATVGQYTGLKDSKGVEIYEGMVVYLAGYGEYKVEFPFGQLYDAHTEGDIGEIIHDKEEK